MGPTPTGSTASSSNKNTIITPTNNNNNNITGIKRHSSLTSSSSNVQQQQQQQRMFFPNDFNKTTIDELLTPRKSNVQHHDSYKISIESNQDNDNEEQKPKNDDDSKDSNNIIVSNNNNDGNLHLKPSVLESNLLHLPDFETSATASAKNNTKEEQQQPRYYVLPSYSTAIRRKNNINKIASIVKNDTIKQQQGQEVKEECNDIDRLNQVATTTTNEVEEEENKEEIELEQRK